MKINLKVILYYLGIILASNFVSCNHKNESNIEYHKYVNFPKKGDIYEIKLNKKVENIEVFYSIYKVESSTRDSVFVHTTEYNLNQKDKLDLLNKKGLFDKELKGFSKSEIQNLLKTNIILKIKRN